MLPEASKESTSDSDSDSDSDEASTQTLVQKTKAKKVHSGTLDSVTLSFASLSFHQTHLRTRMAQAQSQVG